ncbi:MarR family transcriptional regulator [Cytobacillus sp. IB215665]|uniref:MarR family winged helix-turn-helix transcriptional regulator n=1 Tax=Cytobacillus sp. IB215665 TaxID=3097357 RepID=UPI002A1374CB|nr:MarR family transcriptional regulator [Cytobacillus sp. IB215665]MDX8365261.1 MarR family transcriptional regulator [Cytobacillus sp. IB215665]
MFQGDDQSELDLRLFRVWMKSFNTVFKNISLDIDSYGISHEQFMILELLYSKGPHPVQKISETFSIPSGSITYVVDKLEKKDMVKREPIPSDRRAFNVTLTEKGRELFDTIFPKHVETISQNLSFVTNDEKQQLIELLKKIGFGAQEL